MTAMRDVPRGNQDTGRARESKKKKKYLAFPDCTYTVLHILPVAVIKLDNKPH